MEITVFCNGDSENINTWSNVPYFVTKGLTDNGYILHRVDLSTLNPLEKFLQRVYDGILVKYVLKHIYKGTTYSYIRSKLRSVIVGFKMKKAIKQFPETEVFVSLSFTWNPYKYTDKKIICLCDWTYDFDLLHDKNKKPDALERKAIQREYKTMKRASLNVVLRAECREMLIKQGFSNIYPEALNTLNTDFTVDDENAVLKKKANSRIALFMGAVRYAAGAKTLYEAVEQLNQEGYNIEAHYVGLTEKDIDKTPESGAGQVFHGYLKKSCKDEKELYNKLLIDARVCVNTNPDFVSIASLKEANFLYNPIIISKCHQTLTRYGETFPFGLYCENEAGKLKNALKDMFDKNEKEYTGYCIAAHGFFKDASWKNAMHTVMEYIDAGNGDITHGDN